MHNGTSVVDPKYKTFIYILGMSTIQHLSESHDSRVCGRRPLYSQDKPYKGSISYQTYERIIVWYLGSNVYRE